MSLPAELILAIGTDTPSNPAVGDVSLYAKNGDLVILQSNGSQTIIGSGIPDMSGHSNEILTNNGTDARWSDYQYPQSIGTAGRPLVSNGTNVVFSDTALPTAAGAQYEIQINDGAGGFTATPSFTFQQFGLQL